VAVENSHGPADLSVAEILQRQLMRRWPELIDLTLESSDEVSTGDQTCDISN
jgi:hypothetical protein